VRETAITEQTIPIEEEDPEAANMRPSILISCAKKGDSKEKNKSHSKKHGPCPSSSCSNKSRGALTLNNSHTECEEGESDLHRERGDLQCLTMSDPYHQKE
jgi:hypothetical protein